MVTKVIIEKKSSDPWLDEMEEDQFLKLKDCIGKVIVIDKGFVYDNKTYGKTVCMRFTVDGQAHYTTEFGAAIVRQFEELIAPIVGAGDSAEVRVVELTSKKYNSKYVAFDTA